MVSRVLGKMLADARRAAAKAAAKHLVTVTWSPLLHISPRPFDPTLMGFVRESIEAVAGTAPELPSGPLHDAAEMAAIVPTAMVFAQSSPGISHTRLEHTPRPALDRSIRAFLLTVDRALAHLAAQPAPARAKAPAKARAKAPAKAPAKASPRRPAARAKIGRARAAAL